MSASDSIGVIGLVLAVVSLILSVYFYIRTTQAADAIRDMAHALRQLLHEQQDLLQRYREDLNEAQRVSTPKGLWLSMLSEAHNHRVTAGAVRDAGAARGWDDYVIDKAVGELLLERKVEFEGQLGRDTVVRRRPLALKREPESVE